MMGSHSVWVRKKVGLQHRHVKPAAVQRMSKEPTHLTEQLAESLPEGQRLCFPVSVTSMVDSEWAKVKSGFLRNEMRTGVGKRKANCLAEIHVDLAGR